MDYYWWKIQFETTDTSVTIRIKVWKDGTSVPTEWWIVEDLDNIYTQGRLGILFRHGIGFFDDFEVKSLVQYTERILNPSFEVDNGTDFYPGYIWDNAVASDDLPDGWRTTAGYGVIDSSEAFDGLYSLRIDEAYKGHSQYIPIINYDREFIVSGWVKTNCSNPECFGTIKTYCLDRQASIVISDCDLNSPEDVPEIRSNDWTKVEFSIFSDRRDAGFVGVNCYNSPGEPNAVGSVWCDDFSVKELPRNDSPSNSPVIMKSSPMIMKIGLPEALVP